MKVDDGKRILHLLYELGVCSYCDNVDDVVDEEFTFTISADKSIEARHELLELTGVDGVKINLAYDNPKEMLVTLFFNRKNLRRSGGRGINASRGIGSRNPPPQSSPDPRAKKKQAGGS